MITNFKDFEWIITSAPAKLKADIEAIILYQGALYYKGQRI